MLSLDSSDLEDNYMFVRFWIIFNFFGLVVSAETLKKVASFEVTEGQVFEKTKVGGLSGLVFDPIENNWVAVSDDRGRINEPRFYRLDIQSQPFAVQFKGVSFVHPSKKVDSWSKSIMDLEGVAPLPWGNFLISSEGDLNQKPRVNPSLFDVKPNGTVIRQFDLPKDFLPEPTGHQSKGIQNNRGPEGLTASADQKTLWVAMEDATYQEMLKLEKEKKKSDERKIAIVQYEMQEAWIIKPTKNFWYQPTSQQKERTIEVRGISEILWRHDHVIWVMERALEVSVSGMNHSVQIYEVDLDQVDKNQLLTKKLIFNANTVGNKSGVDSKYEIPNFEGMAPGPMLKDGRQTVVLVSDNNFQKSVPTTFWLLVEDSK